MSEWVHADGGVRCTACAAGWHLVCTTPTPDPTEPPPWQHPDECSCPACDFVPAVASKAGLSVADTKRHLSSITRAFGRCATCAHPIRRAHRETAQRVVDAMEADR